MLDARSPRPRRTLVGLGAVALTALSVVSLPVGPASAHDVLVRTTPADGSSVTTLPRSVVLVFDRPALAIGSGVTVTGPAGSGSVTAGQPALDGATVTQRLQRHGPAGTYTVRWRVTSADGHPVSGGFTFTAARSSVVPGYQPTAKSTATPTASASSATSSGSGGSGWTEILLAALAGAAVGVVVVLVQRRRRAGPRP